MTSRIKPTFTVKQYPNERPWICIEPLDPTPGMPPGFFGFDLEDGVDPGKAEDIAKFLNDNLKSFTYTK